MAKAGATANPATLLGDATRYADLRQRLLFLIGALIVYRIGTFIPVPGIDPVALQRFFEQQSGTILSMFNMFSGGALQRLSIFALGIMPYISASIILQMGTHIVPVTSVTVPVMMNPKPGLMTTPCVWKAVAAAIAWNVDSNTVP